MAVATQTMTMSHTLLAASGSINIPRPLKRTSSSFDLDTPHRASKAPRIQHTPTSSSPRSTKPMPLRRTGSCLDLTSPTTPKSSAGRHQPLNLKAKKAVTSAPPPLQQCPVRLTPDTTPHHSHPSSASTPSSSSLHSISPAARTSSPLSPHRSVLPPRPIFPRSKQKQCFSLYRKALTTSLNTNQQERTMSSAERDVVMSDSHGSTWVIVPETEDWDMA